MKRVLILLLLVLVVSCNREVTPTPTQGGYIGNNIYRYVDTEARVVCWVFSSVEKGGIFCMPIGETSLRVGE